MLYDKFPIRVQDLTLERIGAGEFQKIFPGLYNLRKVIENDEWHDNESVFDYTMRVLYNLGQIKKHSPVRIHNYLKQKLDENTQWNILYIAAIFHDIGKEKTLKKNQSGTSCLNHEKEGAEMVGSIMDILVLSDLEKSIVTSIIEYHGHLHNIVYPKNTNLYEQYAILESDKSDIIVELNLLAYADTLSAAPLKLIKPEVFKFRTGFYRHMLDMF